jgi:hypothetical protein
MQHGYRLRPGDFAIGTAFRCTSAEPTFGMNFARSIVTFLLACSPSGLKSGDTIASHYKRPNHSLR